MILKRMAALAGTLITAGLAQAGAWTSTITFSGYSGSETLTDFPVLIKLPDGVPGFSYAQCASDGSDIYFEDSALNVLSSEIDTWNTSGTSYIWVRVPSLIKTTQITMTWNNPDRPAASTETVWKNYVGVWHMNTANGTSGTAEPDRTGNGFDLTPQGNPDAAESKLTQVKTLTEHPAGKAGPVGAFVQNQSEKGNFNGLVTAKDYSDKVTDASVFTASGWFLSRTKKGWGRLLSAKKAETEQTGWEVMVADHYKTIRAVGSGEYKEANWQGTWFSYENLWVYHSIVYNGKSLTIHSFDQSGNSDTRGKTSITPVVARTDGFAVGNNLGITQEGFFGMFDEVRLYNGAVSKDRATADFKTMNAPATFAVASEAKSPEVNPYDFRKLTEPNTVEEDTGAATVYAGVDTTLTVPGTGLLNVGVGKKATLPLAGWAGTVQNEGTVKTLQTGTIDAIPYPGKVEFAGSPCDLTFKNPLQPLVFSGDITIIGAASTTGGRTAITNFFTYVESPVYITGGTTTFRGLVGMGESETTKRGTYGANIYVSGGTVCVSEKGSLDFSDQAARNKCIYMTGGLWTAPLCLYSKDANTPDHPNDKVDVSGTGVFAPERLFGYSPWSHNKVLNEGGNKLYITLHDGGTFVPPADNSATHLIPVTASAGTANLLFTGDATTDFPITIADGATVVVQGTNEQAVVVTPGKTVLSGSGTLVVSNAVLDVSQSDLAGFSGTFRVKSGSTLVLPTTGAAPTYRLALEEGAAVRAPITGTPDQTVAFLGEIIELPASGTATVAIDLPGELPICDYTLTTTALPAGSAEKLTLVLTGGTSEMKGVLAQDANGKLQFKVTESPNPGGELVWAPTSAADTVTDDPNVLAWTRKDAGDAKHYRYFSVLPLWFTDAADYTDVTFAAEATTTKLTVEADKDYIFKGDYKAQVPEVVKAGTGTLTIDGAGFGAPTNILVRGGTLKLGDNATENAFGTDGVITVEPGGRVDINYKKTARAAITGQKKYVLAGTGPDGQGAFGNSVKNSIDGSPVYKVELADDTLIGTAGRINFRPASNTSGSILGEGRTLTVRTDGADNPVIFADLTIAVDRIVVTNDSAIQIAGLKSTTIPNGVDLHDGALIHFYDTYNSSYSAPLHFRKGSAKFMVTSYYAKDGENLTLNATVDVAKDATMQIIDVNKRININFDKAVENNGLIEIEPQVRENPRPTCFKNVLSGTGVLKGAFTFAGNDSNWTMTGAAATRALRCVKVTDGITKTSIAGLKKLTVDFDSEPTQFKYNIGAVSAADAFVTSDLSGIALTVTVAGEAYAPENPLTLGVENGRFVVLNPNGSAGLTVIIK